MKIDRFTIGCLLIILAAAVLLGFGSPVPGVG